MTDTPETDDQAEAAHNMCLYYDCQGKDDNIPYPVVVPAEFSRRLERERDQLKAINAQLLESLEEVLNDWQYGYLASKYECTSYDIARELLIKVRKEKPMTDTPETDLEDDISVDCNNPCYECPMVKASTGEHLTGDFVPAEFARRLERERDQAKREYTAELARESHLHLIKILSGIQP